MKIFKKMDKEKGSLNYQFIRCYYYLYIQGNVNKPVGKLS